jgi:hypothetical protein
MTSRNILSAAILTAAFCLPAAHAEQTATPPAAGGHKMEGMGNMGGMDNMGGMMMSDDRLKMKQEHLLKMHELSNKIMATTDAKEKDRLKAEQLQLMKDHEKQHHMMMQQHMQEMMKNKGGMPGMGNMPSGGMGNMPSGGMGNMQHGSGGMGNMPSGGAGGMGNMQHGNPPAAAQPAAPK